MNKDRSYSIGEHETAVDRSLITVEHEQHLRDVRAHRVRTNRRNSMPAVYGTINLFLGGRERELLIHTPRSES